MNQENKTPIQIIKDHLDATEKPINYQGDWSKPTPVTIDQDPTYDTLHPSTSNGTAKNASMK